jgi:integrase
MQIGGHASVMITGDPQVTQLINPSIRLPSNPSISDLLKALRADTRMWLGRRNKICRLVKQLRHLLNMRLIDIPASPQQLTLTLRQLGIFDDPVKRRRWEQLRPSVRSAAERFGLSEAPSQYPAPLNRRWSALHKRISDERTRLILSQFIHYLSARNISPDKVSDIHPKQFYETVSREGLVRLPQTKYRDICRAWNKARQTVSGWPQTLLTLPAATDTYALPESRFPISFIGDLDSFLQFRESDQLPFGLSRLRPSSSRALRFTIVAFASCLAHCGRPVAKISSLSVLTTQSSASQAIGYLLSRSNGKRTKQMTHIASCAAALGKYWTKAPANVQKRLEELRYEYRWSYDGMAVKNRALVRQFDAQENVARLLQVPAKLRDMATSGEHTAKSARLMSYAVAMEILINAPMRVSELLNIQVDDYKAAQGSQPQQLRIVQYRHLSERPMLRTISKHCGRLMEDYLKNYRPLLAKGRRGPLFLTRRGTVPGANAMRNSIKHWCLVLGQLEVTPTLFCHFAAKHYLDLNPHGLGVVQSVVGHQLPASTFATYGAMRAAEASRQVDLTLFGKAESAQ